MKTSIAVRGAWLFSIALWGLAPVAVLAADDLPPPPLPPLPGEASTEGSTASADIPPIPDAMVTAEATPAPMPATPEPTQTTAANDLPPLPELNLPAPDGQKPLTPEAVLPTAIENASKVPDAAPLPIPEAPAQTATDIPPLPLPMTDEEKAAQEKKLADEAAAKTKETAVASAEAPKTDAEKPKKKKKKKAKQKAVKQEQQIAAFTYHSARLPVNLYRPDGSAKNKHLPRAQFNEQHRLLLLQMCAQNNGNAVRALVESGIDANSIDDNTGQSALHVAVRYNAPKAAAALIGRGANPNAQDNWGKTPMYYATQTGNELLVQLLVQAGATQEFAGLR